MKGNVIVDLLFLIIGLLIVFICAKRGILKSAIHFCKTIFAFLIAYFLGGKLAALLADLWIGAGVRNAVYNTVNGVYQSTAGTMNAQDVIDSLPGFLMTEEMQAKLHAAEGSGEALVNSMTDSIATPITSLVSNILGYVLVFLLALVGLWILAAVLDKMVSHIPVLGKLNTVLGALLGLLIATAVLLALASLVKVFFANSPIYTESVFVKFLGDGALLKGLKFLDFGNAWFSQLLG
ncbi:MAG: CvpA family protein [Clostridia bacterium]|nr:CvpA family protein [Clostridia bacterium]